MWLEETSRIWEQRMDANNFLHEIWDMQACIHIAYCTYGVCKDVAFMNDACTLYRWCTHKWCMHQWVKVLQIPSGSSPCLDVSQWFRLFHLQTNKTVNRNSPALIPQFYPFIISLRKMWTRYHTEFITYFYATKVDICNFLSEKNNKSNWVLFCHYETSLQWFVMILGTVLF